MDVEEQLFADFELLGRSPGIGHLRDDLIPHEIYFYYSRPYLILYRRDVQPIYVLGVIHGARDLVVVMRDRLA